MSKHLMADPELQIPYLEGFFFFYPTKLLCRLLNMPTALKHGYEAMKSPGWPSWKTFEQLQDNPLAVERMRPSTLAKLERMAAEIPETQALRIDPAQLDVVWWPYHDWSTLIASHCLKAAVSKAYWQKRVDAELQLIIQLHQSQNVHDKLRLLLRCNLASKPGCSLARHDVEDLLASDPSSESYENCLELRRFRLCAVLSTLLCFAAWLVAEWEYLTDTLEARVPLERFLPQYNPDAGAWNNPVQVFIKYMAMQAECPPESTASACLGKLWADHEFREDSEGCGRGEQIASKQRLLRNWIKGVGGRPKLGSVRALTKVVAHEVTKPEEPGFELVAEGYARAFVLLETCRAVQNDMSVAKVPIPMIEEVFSVFQPEYLKASTAIAQSMA